MCSKLFFVLAGILNIDHSKEEDVIKYILASKTNVLKESLHHNKKFIWYENLTLPLVEIRNVFQ